MDGSAAEALRFAAISYGFVLIPSMVFLHFAVMSKTFGSLAANERFDGLSPTAIAIAATFGYGLGAFILLMSQLVVTSALEWLALRLQRQPQATFTAALRAHALSEAPMVLGLFPIVGASVATVWALVIRVFAIRRFQQVQTRQAVVALLAPFLCLCGLIAAGLVALLR